MDEFAPKQMIKVGTTDQVLEHQRKPKRPSQKHAGGCGGSRKGREGSGRAVRRTFAGEGELAEVPADLLAVGGALGAREVLVARRAVLDRVLQPPDIGRRVPQRVRRRALRLSGGGARAACGRRRARGRRVVPRAAALSPALVRPRHARRPPGDRRRRGKMRRRASRRRGREERSAVGTAQGGPQEGLGKEGTGRNVPPARRIRRARPNRNVRPGWNHIRTGQLEQLCRISSMQPVCKKFVEFKRCVQSSDHQQQPSIFDFFFKKK